MNILNWVLPALAVATVIANAAVSLSAVNRHEQQFRDIKETQDGHAKEIGDTKTEVAVLKSRIDSLHERGGDR